MVKSKVLVYITGPHQPKNNGYTHASISSICLLSKRLCNIVFSFNLVKRSSSVGMVSLRARKIMLYQIVQITLEEAIYKRTLIDNIIEYNI